ncbi:putative quinol monooxygenase [Rhodoflexus caldus]|uniref:putative quinol monooxygenase n=1 Tax=Rhodoflexus caldus TaxID=2891236 RepID=UPI00202A329E|nr:putative quinol monooxygenase [Rhodoflexus caldus]
MPTLPTGLKITAFMLMICACTHTDRIRQGKNHAPMVVRIAEITIDSAYREEYITILKENAAASVRAEPGVIAIYPMFQKEKPLEIRILEIYTSKEAYEAHLQTPHFKQYKSSTLHMVKSLRLVDMEAIDRETMQQIFRKIGR